MRRTACLIALGSILAAAAARAPATETEHQGFSILPAPGAVKIDGRADDWALSGGVFVCNDVESFRDQFAVWFHAMWDEKNLYVLARWIDHTPLNNRGSTAGDMGFNGDCLQFRVITGYEKPHERVAHFTCWKGSDGRDLVNITYGRDFKGGGHRDARDAGAQQAFEVWPDGKGYTQEIAVPWALLTADGKAPRDEGVVLTVEPNFSAPAGRLTIKDLFRPGVAPDRIFTFRAYRNWSPAALEAKVAPEPRPVRLSDGREFPVAMVEGLLKVDWAGLIASDEPEGFKKITYRLPADGYVSLVIRNADGAVVRQLLTQAFKTAGEHTVLWDGLTTGFVRAPGDPVAPGTYSWEAIHHPGVELHLRGWACAGGNKPWDGGAGRGGWGGDHGVPSSVAADADSVYLGWTGAEAGKAVVAVDLEGKVRWRQTRGGMGGAGSVAALDGVVYVIDHGKVLYRLAAKTGAYVPWEGKSVADMDVIAPVAEGDARPKEANSLAADAGRVFVSYYDAGLVAVLDAKTGELRGKLSVARPVDLKARGGKLYVLSAYDAVLEMDADGRGARTLVSGLKSAHALAVAADGTLYVAVREPDHQVRVFGPDGKPRGTLGRPGGRATRGPWTPEGVFNVRGLGLDARGRLWVMEEDKTPQRISLWSPADGTLLREFCGPTHYGASGGAINPLDPMVLVGEGCEWRIDPASGEACITGVIERGVAGAAKFMVANEGRLYLATFKHRKLQGGGADFDVFQRLGEGDYRLLARFDSFERKLWSDLNGDGEMQDDEVQTLPEHLNVGGYYCWSHGMGDDLSLYGVLRGTGAVHVPLAGFAPGGAPRWDLAKIRKLPVVEAGSIPYPSCDGELLLIQGRGAWHGERWVCLETATGKVCWTYPNPFSGVHGSHRAPPPEAGLIRGAFGVVGTGKLPPPLGRFWIINTNKGEWHVLSEGGFYVTRLFQGDLLRVRWPDAAAPGARLDHVPPGSGEEDFGGSATQAPDGRVFLQTGKTSLWNVELVGLGAVASAGSGQVEITPQDAVEAARLQGEQRQRAAGTPQLAVKRGTPKLSGKMDADFRGMATVSFGRQWPIKAAIAWDERNLYLAWDVKDPTPWVNGADAPEYMYARGDTVDFQLGTDPKAKAGRSEAVKGDLRLSIGPFGGEPTAVVYRKVADEKHPKTFSSGVVAEYVMDSVRVLADAQVKVVTRKDGYTVEAAIPLAALGLRPETGLRLRGDFGATHGNPAGVRTALRTHWSNKATGLVSDEVFELRMEPARWGELLLED